MNAIKSLLAFAIFFIWSYSFSQGVDCMAPTPSNVASQLDYQYNPNTGTANIQIPLCGISAGNFHQEVSLWYNTSGIRVSQVASCVGLGWELGAEPSISRVIRGIPDDQDDVLGIGWLHINSNDVTDFPLDWDEQYKALWLEGILAAITGAESDTEPDLFMLSLPGLSCSFFFGDGSENGQREILTIPFQNIKITYSLDNLGRIEEFTVIDPNGNIFHFDMPVITHNTSRTGLDDSYNITDWFPYVNFHKGDKEPPTKYMYMAGGKTEFALLTIQVDPTQTIYITNTSCWKVSKVITPLLDTLFFNYVNEEIQQDPSSYKSYIKYRSASADTVIAHIIFDENTSTINEKKIHTIESKSGKIEFIYNTQTREDLSNAKKLNTIRAYSKQDNVLSLVREFEFSQSYDISCTSNVYYDSDESKKRLMLNSLTEKNGTNELPPYTFYYDNEGNRKLPSRYSYAQDIWGFYNGKTTNTSLIPKVYVYPERTGNDRFRYYPVTDEVQGEGFDEMFELPGDDRLPDADYMTFDMLTIIDLPTGDALDLDYEPHEFSYNIDDDHTVYIGGGLRLTEKSLAGITEMYHYRTFDTQQSSAQVVALPCFGYFDPAVWPQYEIDRDSGFFNDNYVRVNQDLTNFLEGSILYKEVYIQDCFEGTQVFKYNNGPVLGEENDEEYPWYTPTQIYQCRSSEDISVNRTALLTGLDLGPNEYPFNLNPLYSWGRGLLQESASYTADNELVAKSFQEFEIFVPNGVAPDSVCGITVGFLKNNMPNVLTKPLMVYGKYPVYGNIDYILASSTQTLYEPENPEESLSTQTFYEYNTHKQLTKTKLINSNGDQIISQVKYVPDYWDSPQTPSTTDPMAEAMIALYNINIIDIPIESLQLLIKNGDNDPYVTAGAINTFKFFELDNHRTPIPMPESVYKLQIQNPVLLEDFTTSSIENLKFFKDQRYEAQSVNDIYSTSGILLQSHIVNGNSASYLPGYDSTVIIARCSNALNGEWGYFGFEPHQANGWQGFGPAPEVWATTDARSGDYVLSPDYNCGVQQDFDVSAGLEDQSGYKASIWVKGASSAILQLSINGTDNLKTAASASANEWNLIEVKLSREEIDNYQGTINFIRVMVKNTGYSTVWYDDIRFQPSDASLSSSTYNSWYLISSVSNPDNRYLSYEYNPFGLPLRVRDHDGNILSENQVHIERVGANTNLYTKTIVLKIPEDDPDQLGSLNPYQKSELYQYYDFAGRLEQNVSRQQSPNLKDLVSFFWYDQYGRQNRVYLPFESDYEDGRHMFDPENEQHNFYLNEAHVGTPRNLYPYSDILYDHSPLNRVTESGHPGISWQINGENSHTYKNAIHFNDDEVPIRQFHVNPSTFECYVLAGTEYFVANSLFYNETTDEDGHILGAYYDKSGKLLCQKSLNNNQEQFTYYVYNDLGQLVYLIPPEAFYQMQTTQDYSFSPSDPIALKFIFSFRYDSKGRLSEKKVPGVPFEYFVYDNLNRPIMSQDGNLRSTNKWNFHSFDVQGRVAISGIHTPLSTMTQPQMQEAVDTYYANPAHRNYEMFICESCTTQYETGYSHVSFPYYLLSTAKVMTVNHYDSYDWDYGNSYPFIDDLADNTDKIDGKLSARKVRILNDANPAEWLFHVYYYDEKGRLIETTSDNHLGGRDIKLSELDFSGKPVHNWQYHEIDVNNTIKEFATPLYDHADRLTTLLYAIDNESSPFFMYKNKYNELGQLVEQNIHSLDESNFLQSVDYSYNSRGWLKSINQSNLDNSHYYIDLDQYLTADEAVDGMRIDTIQLSIEQDGKDPGIFNFDFRDDKDIKIIDIDSSYIYRYQEVDEHSLVQIKQGSIDTNIFDNLTDLSGRTLFLEFHDLYFSSSDEQEMILDSLSSLINPELASAGIENPDMVAFLKSQIISHFLKSISIIYFNEDQDDLFGEDMYYDENGAATGLGSTPCYNGNISAIKWQTTQNPGSRSYRFQYDDLNQLIDANYAELEGGSWTKNLGRYDEADLTYDHNGNILTLNRYGLNGIQGGINTFGQMDGLTYSYDGNKLKAVEDNIANSGTNNNDFKDNGSHGTIEYEYDNNGNLAVDDNKGILSITYNHLNLPEEIVFSQTKRINYLYAADGRKLKETITDGAMTHTFDYCSNLVYEDGELSYLLTPAGRAIPTEQEHEYVYEYFLKDHLGNVRVVFGDPDHVNEAEVIQENHYYPFGMTMGGLNYIAGLENRYLYQGKEITGDFGLWWQDFHARRFDSQLGRWHVTDPVIQFASPYIGMGNDPIVFTDPTGMFPTWWNSMDFWLLLNCNLKEVNITADRPEGSNPFGFQEFSGLGGQINSTFGIGSGNSSNSGSGCGGDGSGNASYENNQQAGLVGREHFIGPTLIALGQPLKFLKPFGVLGSKPGSSIASYTLSKALPQTFTKTLGKELGTKVATFLGTNVIGRALGRLVPYVGWGITFYDAVDLTIGWDRVMTPASNDQWIPNRLVFPDGTTIYVCFKAGTKILAKEGLRPIEQFVAGDSVYSYNLDKGIIELSIVTKSFKRETQEIYELTTNDQKIYVTAEHPFYVEGKGWLKVKDLQNGYELKTKVNTKESVLSIICYQRQETVYNIEVEGNHNYFITDSSILVHNK